MMMLSATHRANAFEQTSYRMLYRSNQLCCRRNHNCDDIPKILIIDCVRPERFVKRRKRSAMTSIRFLDRRNTGRDDSRQCAERRSSGHLSLRGDWGMKVQYLGLK
jgi:hypothetical protein